MLGPSKLVARCNSIEMWFIHKNELFRPEVLSNKHFIDSRVFFVAFKNLKFEKGLIQKLISKYIELYKTIQDFGNQSFKVDLPAHLKQYGVHDVFHASLLRTHLPNDDHLFPGHLDSQLGNDIVSAQPEWAVVHIIGHSGEGMEAIFKL